MKKDSKFWNCHNLVILYRKTYELYVCNVYHIGLFINVDDQSDILYKFQLLINLSRWCLLNQLQYPYSESDIPITDYVAKSIVVQTGKKMLNLLYRHKEIYDIYLIGAAANSTTLLSYTWYTHLSVILTISICSSVLWSMVYRYSDGTFHYFWHLYMFMETIICKQSDLLRRSFSWYFNCYYNNVIQQAPIY